MSYSGNNRRGKATYGQHAHPLVREFVAALNEQHTTYREVSRKSGVGVDTLRFWPTRHMPRLDLFVAALNVLGLELCIRPRKEPRHEHDSHVQPVPSNGDARSVAG